MMRSISRVSVLSSLLLSSLLIAPSLASAEPLAPQALQNIRVDADEDGLVVVIVNDDNDGSDIPFVFYTLDFNTYLPVPFQSFDDLGGGVFRDFFRVNWSLSCGGKGEIVAFDGATSATIPFTIACAGRVGTIRGKAFRDGAVFGGAWYKITDGGNWYVCGTVGPDGTYGVPVRAGTYYVIPLNLPGLRASGVMRVVVEGGKASLNNDIRYTSDPSATLDACDLYNPPRPIPSEVRR